MQDNSKNMAHIGIMLISGTALISWEVDHAALSIFIPGIADMTFNTALCFMFITLAYWLLNVHLSVGRSICIGAGALVGLFAALSLSQDAFAISFGIDNLLFDSRGYSLTSPHPGRMSPITASGFLLSSIILISLPGRKQLGRSVAGMDPFILLLTLLLLMVSLLGFGMNMLITNVPEFLTHAASISMFTAISFLLLVITFLGALGITLDLR